MKASIVAIGTELTTGQIVNKNAAWISEKLKSVGIAVSMHLTVPDDRKLILDSFIFAENQTELIFVTGGLGPTSDDFTRDLISEWTAQKNIFNEASWQHIQDRLRSRGFAVKEIQKQQCYFPEGSMILQNKEGTAHAFYLEKNFSSGQKKIFVLPGPPREIASVWNDHIQSWLLENTKNLNKTVTKSWDTMGVGESDVAIKVEEILADRPANYFFEIGYRVHLPYVEVKISYFENDSEIWKPYIEKMNSLLFEITVTQDFIDLAETVSNKIKAVDFTFYDYVSGGYLQNRLMPFLKNHPNYSWKQSNEKPTADFFEHEENFLALIPYEEDKSFVIFEFNGQKHQFLIEAPMKSPLMSERRKQYMAEMALAYFNKI